MIKVKNISISFVGTTIFQDVNIIFNRDDKVGFIGRNGSGKSTFFKLILDQLEADKGVIEIPKNYRIGHLEQHIKFNHESVIDEVCSVLSEEREYEGWKGEEILMGLGFSVEDMLRNPNEFSGGYQVKINLAKLLLDEPNMLLLDEPTNYLDIHSVRWLKKFLRNWKGELILITHDRDFMDSVITHTLNIHRGHFKKTQGNTQNIHEKIALEEDMYEKTRKNEAKQREKTEMWINRFKAKASMAKRAQSKIKLLEKQDQKAKLAHIETLDFEFNCLPNMSKGNFAEVNKLTFGYDDENLIEKLSFKVSMDDRICIIGRNGKGKSTLLKLITGDLTPKEGNIQINNKTEIGYFGQMNIDRLNPNLSIYEEMQNSAPTIDQTSVRKACGNMMFSGGLSNKRIEVLSGGEKSRVMLGKILLKPSNLLLLDEPTNHLDIDSCESLLGAIKNFPGAVLIVTHSEYFLKEMANKLIVFDDDKVFVFEGGYESFLQNVGWSDEQ
ncbi:MAG TPA: ABC-F family ATP-binding cassette domain-containing protein [Gammaproteobacteria bacterium]|nr:ABC-F family ATP-binding cassette domain-containing protein [Gammaproteobacteria bacterium]